jgi:signal peptidase I
MKATVSSLFQCLTAPVTLPSARRSRDQPIPCLLWRRARSEKRRWCLRRSSFAAVGLLACGVARSGLRPGIVLGESMSPTLRSGQWFVLDAGAYRHSGPCRADVILFHHHGITYVKRVLGTGGDTVQLLETRDPDGVWLCPVEPGLLGRARRLCRRSRRWRLLELPVPRGSVYVIGDMVTRSVDSRHLGPIPLSEIRGRIYFAPSAPSTLPNGPIPHAPYSTVARRRTGNHQAMAG